jgi:hypothetical protein
MPIEPQPKPSRPRPSRRKVFSDGRQTPIDRNDRARVLLLADAARRRGEITHGAVAILRALLHKFVNLKDGRCFPSYERIAEAAGCDPRTVGRSLPDLEAIGLVSWVNRLRRVRDRVAGLPGVWAATWRVVRTSNAYDFPAIKKAPRPADPDKGQGALGTHIPDTFFLAAGLSASFERLKTARLARLGKTATA